MAYQERPTDRPGVVLWRRTGAGPDPTLILPDGCLDVIWDGHRAFVAGPDSAARWHVSPPGASYTGLRFAAGTGPLALGVGADELRDRTPDVAEVLGAAAVRRLLSDLGDDPGAALRRWLDGAVGDRLPDPLGRRVHALSDAGLTAGEVAREVGYSERQLRRRCDHLFGYGLRRLGRILRLQRGLEAARSGTPLAAVAAGCGFADQAHLSRECRDLTGLAPTALLAAVGSG